MLIYLCQWRPILDNGDSVLGWRPVVWYLREKEEASSNIYIATSPPFRSRAPTSARPQSRLVAQDCCTYRPHCYISPSYNICIEFFDWRPCRHRNPYDRMLAPVVWYSMHYSRRDARSGPDDTEQAHDDVDEEKRIRRIRRKGRWVMQATLYIRIYINIATVFLFSYK